MDITTIVGLIAGFTLLVMGTFNYLESFVDLGSLLIVVGGSYAATLISFPLAEVVRFPGVLRYAFYLPGPYKRIVYPERYPSNSTEDEKPKEDVVAIEEELKLGIMMLKRLKTYTLAFGWIAVLIGFIIILSNLDDPKALGPGVALSLISLYYGAVIAYLIYLPLQTKLERRLEALQKS